MGVPQIRWAIHTCLYPAVPNFVAWQRYLWSRVWLLKPIRQIWSPYIIISLRSGTSGSFYALTFSRSFSRMDLRLPTCMTVPLHIVQLAIIVSRAYLAAANINTEPLDRAFSWQEPDWAYLGHSWSACACSRKAASDLIQLEQALRREWLAIPQVQIQHLIRSRRRWCMALIQIAALIQIGGGHMLLTLWTLDSDPCLIPWPAVTTQWNESLKMKCMLSYFQKWTRFPTIIDLLGLNSN